MYLCNIHNKSTITEISMPSSITPAINHRQPRQSNMELLRIIAMVLVVLLHSNFKSLGAIEFHSQVVANPLSSFIRLELDVFSILAVNLFVLISGYFGIRPKLKSVLNIVFQLIFWKTILAIISYTAEGFTLSEVAKNLGNGILFGGWFIPCYFLLMLIAPALNSYIEASSKKDIFKFLLIFYGVQTTLGWLIPLWPYIDGYSFVSFIGLYMLGRYINKFMNDQQRDKITFKRGLAGYALISALLGVGGFLFYYFVDMDYLCHLVDRAINNYTSPFNILCAALLIIGFSNLKLYSKVVNRLAQSAFAVYIIHLDPAVFDYIKATSIYLYDNFNIWVFAGGAILLAISVYLVCALGDTVRIWAWNKLCSIIPVLR